MHDLGYTPPAPKQTLGATPVTIVSEQDAERKPQYPSLSLNGSQAKSAGLTKCAHGDEYEITVRLRAKRIGGWDYPGGGNGDDDAPPMEFDVLSSSEPKAVKTEETEEGEEETQASKESEKKARRVKSPKDMGFKDAYAEKD